MLLTLRWWCKKACAKSLAALAAAAFLAFAAAGGAAGASDNVMLDVIDLPLETVLLMLSQQQSGVNIVISDPEIKTKRVTARLVDKPLETVLDNVLKSAQVGYHKTADGTYIIGDAGSDVTQAVAPEVIEVAQAVAEPVQAVKRRVRTESIKLQNSSPSEILRVLNWSGGPEGAGGAMTANPGLDVDEVFPGKPKSPDRDRATSPVGGIINMSPGSEAVPPAMDSTGLNGPVGAGRTAGENEGSGQWPGASARPSYGQGNTYGGANPYGGQGGNRQPNQPQGGNSSSGNGGLLPEGIDFVMPYDIDNSIVVRGDDDGIAEFKDLVHMLDIPPKQVKIKAEFVEVATQDIENFGIDWSIERLNATFNTTFNPSGNVLLGFQAGNVSAQVAAELSSTKGRVINSPIISTLNNTPATINIGKTVPFFSSITQSVGEGQLVTSEQLVELPVQTYLFVLPRVNGDGSITLYLEPNISDTGTIYKSGKGTAFPERTFQTIRTNRRVMNGETIVIGGFVRKDDSSSVSRVPILGDLPIIRNFFRSKIRKAEDRELLIFVTPEVIPDRTGGSVGVTP